MHLSFFNERFFQAAKKTENVTKILRKIVFDIERQNPSLKQYFFAQKEKGGGDRGTPMEINTIVQSPCLNGYRNKCEFTIGLYPLQQIINNAIL